MDPSLILSMYHQTFAFLYHRQSALLQVPSLSFRSFLPSGDHMLHHRFFVCKLQHENNGDEEKVISFEKNGSGITVQIATELDIHRGCCIQFKYVCEEMAIISSGPSGGFDRYHCTSC